MSHHADVAPDILRLHNNTGIPSSKLGMWLFLASDAMGFVGLLGTYIVLRFGAGEHWPVAKHVLAIPLVTLNTFILICSSVTMVLALDGQKKGDMERYNLYILLTALLGLVFVGIQGVEWYELMHLGFHAGSSPDGFSSVFGASFYVLTGYHGFHVLIGVLYLLYNWSVSVLSGQDGGPVYGSKNTMPTEILGLYWHFVDLVWIILFTVIYLM
jgi:cytochrome c oxidase subunit 3